MFNENVFVHTSNHTYEIKIGYSLFKKKYLFYPFNKNDKVVLVTNTTVSKFFKKMVLDYLLNINIDVSDFVLSDGENFKNLNSVELLLGYLLKNNFDRNTILIALGGGVIGDLTGFVASIYQRGIRVIQIPTTLLSQVDASIGGKTGVNHILGKNMIGTFWQPSAVIIDVCFLTTLPINQLISGIAEVIKYAIIFDIDFFQWLEDNIEKILVMDPNSLLYCIKKCCDLKSKVVFFDERENNLRCLLNFGHTYGHAIESYFKYSLFLHGEAISIGMVIASRTAKILKLLNDFDENRIINLLKLANLPFSAPKNMPPEEYLPYMKRDKKSRNGNIKLILPVSIGKVKIFNKIDKNIILQSIQECIL
ncbi:3-dehydroquinate synthase [Buchnera aphidicola]|uniref:3-dehydroquinate synthase n=1 Tax=Buchnera aphidicola TaxID=9 RepID=UPI003463E56C